MRLPSERLESDPVVLQYAVLVETIDQCGPLLGIDDAIEPIGADEVVRLGHTQHAAHGRVRLEQGRFAAPRAAEDAETQSIRHGPELLARLVERGLHGFLTGQAARDEDDPVLTRERDGGDCEHHVDGPPVLGLEASLKCRGQIAPETGAALRGQILDESYGLSVLRRIVHEEQRKLHVGQLLRLVAEHVLQGLVGVDRLVVEGHDDALG